MSTHAPTRRAASRRVFWTSLVLFVAVLGGAYWSCSNHVAPLEGVPDQVDFNWHVRPILSDRCFKCHGPDEKKRQAGLRLDTEAGAMAALPPDSAHLDAPARYAIVPGRPDQSELVRRIFSTHPDTIMPTPESHLVLTDAEKQILRRWIEQGAKWKQHWAFAPPVRPELPAGSAQHPIDAFIQDKWKEKGMEGNPEADKATLLRRVSFDLTGLPPDATLLARFMADEAPDAYERAVDSLLARPAYGERWAMFWLDLARYSDTHGYQDDLPRVMWPWRDWVIHAYNQNMPYDQFVTWQLAGDLLPEANKETLLASGFCRNHKISQEGGVIEEEYRIEYVTDRTNTFSKAFLGLTMECSKCHDHKYDPISTAEYYGTTAFFNKVPEQGFVPNLATPKPYMTITQDDLKGVLSFLKADEVLKTAKDTILQMVMGDSLKGGGRKAYVLARGQYDQHAQEVPDHTPAAVLPYDREKLPPNRLGLAQWLFDPRHPLTGRVAANHLWQEVFGRGLVATSENFGVQGALPSHPELLDWLAVEYRESGWDMKHMLRLMVTSGTYKQRSSCTEAQQNRDPENQWLARGPRYRMPYEFIRDNVLASSGLLVGTVGGPSVRPWQPPGIWEEIACEKSPINFRGEFSYKTDTAHAKAHRRSLYTYNRRTIPPPASAMFDAPVRDDCTVRRTRTSTPLQALNMLNDQQVLEAARHLSALLMAPSRGVVNVEMSLQSAFQRITGRTPRADELGLLRELYETEHQRYTAQPERAHAILKVGTRPYSSPYAPPEHAALMLAVCAIYNLDETFTKL
jgi:Protein of unknown function (DUF1553)/Protein of unknown function (DUF1549)/Planctomycete cytochrome C